MRADDANRFHQPLPTQSSPFLSLRAKRSNLVHRGGHDSRGNRAMIRATLARREPMTDLLETTENGIATLTLNRPERLNALSPAMTAGLKEALERLSTDREVGAIVIAGAGRGWCAGGDVKTMDARGEGQTFEDRAEGLREAHRLPLLLRTMPKIVIASINGPVAGDGIGIALG